RERGRGGGEAMTPRALGEVRPGAVALVGVPLDENSSLLRGPAQAPGRIREGLYSGSSSDCAENGTLGPGSEAVGDLGDLPLGTGEIAMQEIERGVGVILERQAYALALGGDHSVTWPIVRAHAARHPDLAILQFDAHPDLYDTFDGN